VTVVKSSTVQEDNQQSCVVHDWTCGRLALASRHELQSVDGVVTCPSCNWNAQLLEVGPLWCSLIASLEDD